jgi:hypothetical protein
MPERSNGPAAFPVIAVLILTIVLYCNRSRTMFNIVHLEAGAVSQVVSAYEQFRVGIPAGIPHTRPRIRSSGFSPPGILPPAAIVIVKSHIRSVEVHSQPA